MRNSRPLAAAVLVLCTLIGLIAADDMADPFPIPSSAAVYMEYRIQPLDNGIYTITDRSAVERVLACLNETGRGVRDFDARRPNMLDRDYEIGFLRPDGRYFSLTVWGAADTLELHMRGNWIYQTDTGPLCALLDEILEARSSGMLE